MASTTDRFCFTGRWHSVRKVKEDDIFASVWNCWSPVNKDLNRIAGSGSAPKDKREVWSRQVHNEPSSKRYKPFNNYYMGHVKACIGKFGKKEKDTRGIACKSDGKRLHWELSRLLVRMYKEVLATNRIEELQQFANAIYMLLEKGQGYGGPALSFIFFWNINKIKQNQIWN